jgi:type II secretory pathway component GspD/PulD (secretin)
MGKFLQSNLLRAFPWACMVLVCYFWAAGASKAQDPFLFDPYFEAPPSTSDDNSAKTDSKSQSEENKSDEQSKTVKQSEAESKSAEEPAQTDEASAKSEDTERPGGPSEKSTNSFERRFDRPPRRDFSRPMGPPSRSQKSPNPDELKVQPGEDGKYLFNFNGQPWLPVLEWLAKISGKSLDWQEKELPTDKLYANMPSSYTVEEVHNLINRYLLMRGYTLLTQGDILTVANIKKIDPSLVPRVAPEDLDKLQPYEFVKVCFPLDWMLAETAVTELAPLKSPNGKLTALKTTNRLEAMDAVSNLRDIWRLLKEEQSDSSQERLVREFKLKYARASEVCQQIQTLLGEGSLSSAESSQQTESPDNQRGMNVPGPGGGGFPGGPGGFMTGMMQFMGGGRGDRGDRGDRFNRQTTTARTKPTDFTLVVNPRMNSILAHATPDKMAIISQAIEAIDVPVDNARSLLTNLNRMQVYRLSGIDPEPVVKTLEEIGNLDPSTRLQVDAKNKAIIAYASLPDHVTIRMVVNKLSGSERRFEVIPLRRLEADYVAGSIEFMMGAESSSQNNQNTQNNPVFGFGGRRGFQPTSTASTEQKPDQFRVSADIEHNRLLLWANEVELGEVENLLVKLGEIPPKGSPSESVRIIDTYNVKEAEELLDRVRRAWPSGANPLLITPPPATKKPSSKPPEEKRPLADISSKSAALKSSPPNLFKLVQFQREENPASQSGKDQTAEQKALPPVEVTINPEGNIVAYSDDPEALALFEDLMMQLAPPRKNYQVFHLKYSMAVGVAQTLEEFFSDEEQQNQNQSPFGGRNRFIFNPFQQETKTDTRASLSKRRPLKFIPDADSNTILVENADPAQLKTIADLLELYDQPLPTDSQSIRKTQTVHLESSKADSVAETVKEVYRDLLSSNDKSLQSPGGGPNMRMPNFMFLSSSDSENVGQKAPKFKGLLSIGVDDLSNSLVVSAPVFLFDQVVQMIKELDEAAAPSSTIKVVKLGAGVSSDKTRAVLSALLGQSQSGYTQQSQFQQYRQRSSQQQQGRSSRSNRSSSNQQQNRGSFRGQGGGGFRGQGGGGGPGGGMGGGPGGGMGGGPRGGP